MKEASLKITSDLENIFEFKVQGTDTIIAIIRLDSLHQIEQVLFSKNFLEKELRPIEIEMKKDIRNLVAFHVTSFIKRRNKYFRSSHLKMENRNTSLTYRDSNKLMDFSKIPDEIKNCPEEEKDRLFEVFDIQILDAVVSTHDEALQKILEIAELQDNVTFEMRASSNKWLGPWVILTSKIKDGEFTFWDSLRKPSEEVSEMWDLNIVPHYHPCMNEALKSVGAINGATNAFIRGFAIDEIHPPKESLSEGERYSSNWFNVNHPCKAIGKEFEMSISYFKLFTQKGIEEIASVLKAASGKGRTYATTIQGFSGPFNCAENVINQLIRNGNSEFQGNLKKIRGSEASCVWMYHVLTEEGVIDKAYIPKWFTEEKWLEIYELYEKNNVAAD